MNKNEALSTAQLIAAAEAADATLTASDDYVTCCAADTALTAQWTELCRRSDAGDAAAGAWLAAGRMNTRWPQALRQARFKAAGRCA